ncbi:DUF2061 domain-containing protein [Marinomonas sp. TI.3.20]|uniref:DUF2061 domain-containing protein n=1 Tax=Marinomonas sp. TI.3.20 TaxID=3121296 RepID=UPI00311D867C
MTKTLTFAAMHFSIAFTVAYLITGSFVVGGILAIVEPAVNTVAFYFHEKIWTKYAKSPAKRSFNNAWQATSESYALRAM